MTRTATRPPPARKRHGGNARSLHQQILSDVEGHIVSGRWPPGHRIPFEHELKSHYRCSRMTVNKVLRQLADAGLIERRRKAGTFVRQPVSQSAVLEISDIKAEVAALGLSYRFEVLRRKNRTITSAERKRLDLAPSSGVVDVACRHFAGPRPFCLEERLISHTAVPQAVQESFEDVAPGPWLLRHIPWTAAEHEIRAIGANPTTASVLRIGRGSPCLVIERRTWRGGQPVTFVRLTYPGEIHQLVARFTPSQS